MTTVIAVYKFSGCVGRCDANCHEAKSPECTCICGGANHGQGLKQAMANTARGIGLNGDAVDAYIKLKGITDPVVSLDRVQLKGRNVALKRARKMIGEPPLPLWLEKANAV
jgi:hypothetical protein